MGNVEVEGKLENVKMATAVSDFFLSDDAAQGQKQNGDKIS